MSHKHEVVMRGDMDNTDTYNGFANVRLDRDAAARYLNRNAGAHPWVQAYCPLAGPCDWEGARHTSADDLVDEAVAHRDGLAVDLLDLIGGAS